MHVFHPHLIDHNPASSHMIVDPTCTTKGFRGNEFMQTLSAIVPFRFPLAPSPPLLFSVSSDRGFLQRTLQMTGGD